MKLADLYEKAMNAKTFGEVGSRLATIAKVGFEFELLVHDENRHYDDTADTERNTIPIQRFDSLDEFDEYFTIAYLKDIRRDYDRWVEEKAREYADEHWEQLNPDDERTGRRDAEKDFHYNLDRSRASFGDWLRDVFPKRKDFVDEYGLEPEYGWYDESRDHAAIYSEPSDSQHAGSAKNLAASLNKHLSINPVISSEYHGARKNTKDWYIEPDSSIKGKGHGLELVSPPQELAAARKTLRSVAAWMSSEDLETNATTGLHINVSVPDLAEKLDPVKLVLFMGEDYAAAEFGRKGNTFTSPQIQYIMQAVKKTGVLPSSEKQMHTTAMKFLAQGKHFSVNFGHIGKGYLEFRVAGGVDYHKDVEKVDKMILRLVTAVDLACRPEEARQEYLKKLAALFTKSGDQLQRVTKGDQDKLPKELHRLYRYSPDIMEAWKRFENHDSIDKNGRSTLMLLLVQAVNTAKSFNTSLDLKERVFFKRLAKDVNLHSHDVDEFYHNDPLARQRFKKELGI